MRIQTSPQGEGTARFVHELQAERRLPLEEFHRLRGLVPRVPLTVREAVLEAAPGLAIALGMLEEARHGGVPPIIAAGGIPAAPGLAIALDMIEEARRGGVPPIIAAGGIPAREPQG